jgi:hypothetical protein
VDNLCHYRSLWEGLPINTYMSKRNLCPTCLANPVAINYIRDGVTHYRSKCSACIRKGKKLKPTPPLWAKSGYKKLERCEVCNFKAKYPTKQLFVFHVDGNLKNTNWHNLKTVCANCRIELDNNRVPWKQAAIVPDF